jgi:integrase
MSEDHPTVSPIPDKPEKPIKPSPDFPLFPHATGRWAKKVRGKMRYFGRWNDPEGALREYQAFLDSEPVERQQRPSHPDVDRPAKPSPDFPLFAHATGQWAKKIRGKMHYFGPWHDPDGALRRYNEQRNALHSGRKPRSDPGTITVKDVANDYLNAKQKAVEAGELSPRTWADYKSIMDMLVEGLGKRREVATLVPADFAALKTKLAKRNGPHRMCTVIQVIRCAFKRAYESGTLDRPMRFGPDFKRTPKKVLRLHRARQGVKLFTAEEIRRLIGTAGLAMKAMILLGINAGLGNQDCGTLPLSAVNLDRGWLDFPRPKTGLPRRCALWPETVQAIREALANRPKPKDEADTGLVFITKYGFGWAKIDNAGPITQEMRKLLKQLGINGHRNFYTLRHTFRTIADDAKDQPAADFIMGHEVAHMSSGYRETISDDRLKAVTDHVRAWLFPPTKAETEEALEAAEAHSPRPVE